MSVLLVLGLAAAGAVVTAPLASADGPTTFANSASIAIPATGSANQTGPASPYPSPVTVSGMAGAVTTVTVTFHNLSHSTVNDIDALLVAPTGQSLVVLSDVGDPNTLAFASNATLTFSDAAAGPVPTGNIPSGTYRPTNNGTGDTFPAPAPSPSTQTTLAGAFTGINPNGTWQLFVVDDTTGDIGAMAGGWSLTVTTEVAAVATSTSVTTSGTPSTTGSAVTFRATVTAAGSPVIAGSVQFSDGATSLGSAVALNASGTASLSTSALAEGTHEIRATYSGASGFLTSNGSVTQRVDNPTVVTGDTYCNPGPLTVPALGAAAPYPSNITVSGRTGTVTAVTARLVGVSHQVPVDLDVMLSGPTPATNLLLLSDAGGPSEVSGLTLTFDDTAAGPVPTPMVSGTFRPTDDDSDGRADTFPAPAPAPSSATALATFVGANPNGTWSLWVNDDASGDSGSISGGWCITVSTTRATSTSLVSSLNPSPVGTPVTFTASVASAGGAVGSGSVQFSDGANPLGAPVPLSAAGTAALTTSALAVGTHQVTAAYSGDGTNLPSEATLTQNVDPVADAGGPYTVAEGASLTLDAGGSTAGATYDWDVNHDGDYTDATGVTPTLTWADLQALGIDDGPASHVVSLRVSLAGRTETAEGQLTVTNTAPTSVVTGGLNATVGQPFTLKVGADDPSSADLAAPFTYTVNWGDGSAVETVTGPADPPVTHTYAVSGTFSASFTATDKDGGTGAPTTVSVQVSDATTTSTTSTTTTSTTSTTTTSTETTSTTSTTSPATTSATTTTGGSTSSGSPTSTPSSGSTPASRPANPTTNGSGLPATGTDLLLPVSVAVVLLLAGSAMVVVRRRR